MRRRLALDGLGGLLRSVDCVRSGYPGVAHSHIALTVDFVDVHARVRRVLLGYLVDSMLWLVFLERKDSQQECSRS